MALFNTLIDKFDDGIFNNTLFSKFEYDGATVTETTELIFDIPGYSGGPSPYAGFESNAMRYDLTNNAVFMEVKQVATGSYSQTLLQLINNNEALTFLFNGTDTLQFQVYSATGSYTSNITYNAINHRWWRIRNSGSTIYFDASATGSGWVNLYSAPSLFNITNLYPSICAYYYAPTAKTTTAIIDNLNIYTQKRSLGSASTGGGNGSLVSEKAAYSLGTHITPSSNGSYLNVFQPLPQKDYEYRVFDHLGNFKAIWQEVTNDFTYSQAINENASELTVNLARNPESRASKFETIKDQGGNDILDSDSSPILLQTSTANAVGEGTDVEINDNVDVYAYYGGYDQLLDQNNAPILDGLGDAILAQFGSPNGLRVYSGYIADYELEFGDKQGVQVKVVPHATEMSHFIYKTVGGLTTVVQNTVDPVSTSRAALDNYNSQGGVITYDVGSMPLSGEIASYTYKLQATREVVDKTIELLPSGYFHYVHPGENKQYLLEKADTPHHTFYYEKHITELKLRKSITQLVNKAYFVGGEPTPGTVLFKYYEDATSITNYRPGLVRQSDSRVTLSTSAATLSQVKIEEYKEPRYRTSITITDKVYDIESIRLGQMVGFKNFGSFVDLLILQIVNITKNKHTVTLDLDMNVSNETKRLEDIKRRLQTQEIEGIDTQPS